MFIVKIYDLSHRNSYELDEYNPYAMPTYGKSGSASIWEYDKERYINYGQIQKMQIT